MSISEFLDIHWRKSMPDFSRKCRGLMNNYYSDLLARQNFRIAV